jgi:hypothetical protein
MMNVRDTLSTAVFYLGVFLLFYGMVRFGTTYGWEGVDERFREMEPAIKRNHHYWVDKRFNAPSKLGYEDIIMYERPLHKRSVYRYEFGRVVGKPGDVLNLEDGKLFRAERLPDGLGKRQMIAEHYAHARRYRARFDTFMVPRDTVLVLYDDRNEFPPISDLLVPTRAIYGKVIR